ncbi:MAG: hypothetical protein K2X87_22770 [Gemmataceae bacterium]|nr:hypothetical protein [Gemmataceae bacterium]
MRARRSAGPDVTKARLSVTQAEDRNAPNSFFSPLDPLADIANPTPPATGRTPAAVAAPSVITVTAPKAPTPAEPLVLLRPPAEPTASPSSTPRPVVRVGDPFLTDILWDPGTTPRPVYLGGLSEPAKEPRRPGGDEPPAGGGPTAGDRTPFVVAPGTGFGFDPRGAAPLPGGGTGFGGGPSRPPKAGVGSGTGDGYGVTSGSGSGSGATGDLDIYEPNGNWYAEEKEENPGGWVALNNDNDNYNFHNDPDGKSLAHVYDKDDPTNVKVPRENDLVGINVHDTSAGTRNGVLSLQWTSSKIRVWGTADKDGGPLTSGVALALGGDFDFYVEGVSPSTASTAEQIKLLWTPNGSPGSQLVDAVNFTVYEVNGVMNVPGYSEYAYTVRTPDARGSSISVLSGGQNKATTTDPTTFTTARKILWDGGPVLGTYRVTPVAGEPFYVDREVNVVKVDLESVAGANNQLDYKNPPYQPTGAADPDSTPPGTPPPRWETGKRAILSAKFTTQPYAVKSTLRVNRIEGPVVVGESKMRGVRFIDVGMIQNARFTEKRGVFGFTPTRYSISSLEYTPGTGPEYYVDTRNKPFIQVSEFPYYSSGTDPVTSLPGLVRPGIDPAAGAPILNTVLSIADRPYLYATGSLSMTFGGVTKPVSQFKLVFDSNLYMAVRTRDTGPGSADRVFTQRGKATWKFDGSGSVDATGKWDDSKAGNSGNGSFSLVTDGSVVPATTGGEINSTLPGETWTEGG